MFSILTYRLLRLLTSLLQCKTQGPSTSMESLPERGASQLAPKCGKMFLSIMEPLNFLSSVESPRTWPVVIAYIMLISLPPRTVTTYRFLQHYRLLLSQTKLNHVLLCIC